MAIREKIFIPNKIYFITFTILGWKNVFIDDKYFLLVYKWFDYMREKYENKIYGYVIMPNHIHLLIYISSKSSKLSVLIQNAKRFFAYQIVKLLEEDNNFELLNYFKKYAEVQKGAKHKVFENRYDSKIVQSQGFFLEKLNYIHNNPCVEKWNLAENPEDYIHSSASNYLVGNGMYNVDVMEI